MRVRGISSRRGIRGMSQTRGAVEFVAVSNSARDQLQNKRKAERCYAEQRYERKRAGRLG